MFTFNDHGHIYFDQTKWATYMEAMKEDKPPPDCSHRTKKSDVSKGAAYLARKTLVLTEEFFRVRYNEAIQLTEGKLDIRTYYTVRNRKIETGEIETILIRASVSLKKIETDLLGSWWP